MRSCGPLGRLAACRRRLLRPPALLALAVLASFLPLRAAADAPERLALEGVPAAVTPPAGAWLRSTTAPAPGQWAAGFRAEDGTASLEARVFPVRDLTDPRKVLLQAIDVAVRSAVAEGFGIGGITATTLEGRPAADASFTAALGGLAWSGHARLLRATDHAWAFAWGMAAEDASAARQEAVRAFVQSLAPTGPRFHDPAFRAADLEQVALAVAGEEPITNAHLHAAVGLAEEALGLRLSVADAARLRSQVLAAAREGRSAVEVRGRLRDALAAVRDAEALGGDMRRSALRLAGVPLLGFLRRPGVLGLFAREVDRASLAAASHREWIAFVVSLALDAPVSPAEVLPEPPPEPPEGPEPAAAEERRAWLAWGTSWAAVRRAWDLASEERRFPFRREVIRLLAPAEDRERIEDLADPAALQGWLSSRVRPTPEEAAGRAVLWDAAARRRLLDLLGVRDEGYQLGW